jgi:hypothetical protein
MLLLPLIDGVEVKICTLCLILSTSTNSKETIKLDTTFLKSNEEKRVREMFAKEYNQIASTYKG